MDAVDRLRESLPPFAKDIQLNVGAVLQGGALSEPQRWGVAAACAIASGNAVLRDAMLADALAHGGEALVDDAKAAASLMAMNNVYYRFRHQIGKESYAAKPARLRMNRMAQPKADKVTFELMSLAVSAIHGCELCVKAHESAVLDGGLTEDHVHDAVRIAAVMRGAAAALSA